MTTTDQTLAVEILNAPTANTTIDVITLGAQGLRGATGPPGPQGDTGQAGSVWRDGAGPPDDTVGVDGDLYLNTSNGDVWQRASGSYSPIANIQGPQGIQGDAATNTVLSGAGVPNDGDGDIGDFYIDTVANDIYGPKTLTWGSPTSLIGPVGPSGSGTDAATLLGETLTLTTSPDVVTLAAGWATTGTLAATGISTFTGTTFHEGGLLAQSGPFGLTATLTEYNNTSACLDMRGGRDLIDGTQAASHSGDTVARILFAGSDDDSKAGAARIAVVTTEAWSNSATGAQMQFLVNPNGTPSNSHGVGGMILDQDYSLTVDGSVRAPNLMQLDALASNTVGVVTSFASKFGVRAYAGSGPNFVIERVNGNTGAGTPLASADQLGLMGFGGSSTTATNPSTPVTASMHAIATQTFTSTHGGTKLVFDTTPNDSVTRTIALTLEQDQTATFTGSVRASNMLQLDALHTNSVNVVTAFSGQLGARAYAGSGLNFVLARVNGTTSAGTPLASGDQLALVGFAGAQTTAANPATGVTASIAAAATQDFTSTHGGTKLTFSTTPNDSVTRTIALTIDQDQTATFASTVRAPTIAGGSGASDDLIIKASTNGSPSGDISFFGGVAGADEVGKFFGGYGAFAANRGAFVTGGFAGLSLVITEYQGTSACIDMRGGQDTNGGAQSPSLSGDTLTRILFAGSTEAAKAGAARIAVVAAEDWSSSATGANMEFYTNPLGTAANTHGTLGMTLTSEHDLIVEGSITAASISSADALSLAHVPTNAINVAAPATLGAIGYRAYGVATNLYLENANGSTSSGTPVTSAQNIAIIAFRGATTTAANPTMYSGAQIIAKSTEAYSSTAGGTQLLFQTTANTTHTVGTALTLNQDKTATFAAGLTTNGTVYGGSAAADNLILSPSSNGSPTGYVDIIASTLGTTGLRVFATGLTQAYGGFAAENNILGLTIVGTEYNGTTATIDLRSNRGSSSSSFSHSLSGDIIGRYLFAGSTDSALRGAATIQATATENFGTSWGTKFQFLNSPTGTAPSGAHGDLAMTLEANKTLTIEGGGVTYANAAMTNTATRTEFSASSTQTFSTTASMSHYCFRTTGTDTWTVAPGSTGMYIGFSNERTFNNDPGANINLAGIISFQAVYTKTIDTATGKSLGVDNDFYSAPTYTRANSGTFTTTTQHAGFYSIPTINATGCTMLAHTGFRSAAFVTAGTVTTFTHFLANNPTITGTVTTQIGLDIAALSGAGTNIGIRNAASTQLGSAQQLTVDTSGNLSTSGTITTTGSGTLTVASTSTLAAVNISGDVAVATNKFTVAAASGNTVVAGTLNVTGAVTSGAINGVTISSGAVSGVTTLAMTGALTGATNLLDLSAAASDTQNVTALATLGAVALRSYGSATDIQLQRAQGTAGSSTVVVSGNVIARLSGRGATTAGPNPTMYTSTRIDITATEDYSSTAGGSKMTFLVTANTTHSIATALTLDQDKSATFAGAVTNSSTTALNGTVTMGSGINIVLNTGTGTQIGTATNQKLGFFGATAIVQGTAFTQTYSTASHTHAARTSSALATTAATQTTPWGFSTQAQADAIATKTNQIRADLDSTAQVLNALIDDLQALGLVG